MPLKVLQLLIVFFVFHNQAAISQETTYPFLVGPIFVSKNSESKTSSELKSEAISNYTISAFNILIKRITTSKFHKELLELKEDKINTLLQSMLVSNEQIGQSFYQAKLSFEFNQKALEDFFSSKQIEYYPLPKINVQVVTDDRLLKKNQRNYWQTNWKTISASQNSGGFSTVSPRIVYSTYKQNILDNLNRQNIATFQKIHSSNPSNYLFFIKIDKLANSILTSKLSIFDGLNIRKVLVSQNFKSDIDQNQLIFNNIVNFRQIIRDNLIRQFIKNSSVSDTLAFQLDFDNLYTWNQVYEKLEKIKNIDEIFPININYNQAEIEIKYHGSFENLYKLLAKSKLILTQNGQYWRIQPKL